MTVNSAQLEGAGSARALLFVAGDLSGDMNAALLARETLKRHPDWTIHVLGGSNLQAVARDSPGGSVVGDTTGYGVIGFTSALAITPRLYRLKQHLLRFLDSHKVDGVVLCDWGGFNTRILAKLKERRLPVLYYFPPRSWQKQGKGGLAIVPWVNCVATPFPWSAERLRAAGCNAEWVGHPLLELERTANRQAMRDLLGVLPDERLIAVLPGSRRMELECLGPHLAGAIELLDRDEACGHLRFVVAVPEGSGELARTYFPATIPILEGGARDVLGACDAAFVKSGTSTLEAAVAGAPQVVVYDVPPLLRAQWVLTGMGRKIPFVAMPNIILQRRAVPEIIGNRCSAASFAQAMKELLNDASRLDRMREDYKEVRRVLGSELPYTATCRAATMLEGMVDAAKPDD